MIRCEFCGEMLSTGGTHSCAESNPVVRKRRELYHSLYLLAYRECLRNALGYGGDNPSTVAENAKRLTDAAICEIWPLEQGND